MFTVFRKLHALLNPQERRRATWLLLLILGAALVEVVGVASVMPFVAVLSNPQVLESNVYLASLYEWSGFQELRSFMIVLGAAVLIVFVSSLTLKALSTYAILRFSNMRSHAFSYRLLAGYLARPYVFFLVKYSRPEQNAVFGSQ